MDEEELDEYFSEFGDFDFDEDFDEDFAEVDSPCQNGGEYKTFTRTKIVLMIGHDGTFETKQALYAYMDTIGADNLIENGPKTTSFVWDCRSNEQFAIECKSMIQGVCDFNQFKHSLRVDEETVTLWVSE